MSLLEILAKHGLSFAAQVENPDIKAWLTAMIQSMRHLGLEGIQRRLRVGYGNISRALDSGVQG